MRPSAPALSCLLCLPCLAVLLATSAPAADAPTAPAQGRTGSAQDQTAAAPGETATAPAAAPSTREPRPSPAPRGPRGPRGNRGTPALDPRLPAAPLFAAVRTPGPGAPSVFGTYSRGCIAGAQQLSLDAPRWQVMRPSRNRAWGHPALLRFVERLADDVAKDGVPGLLVGDLGQPRGGPTPTGHGSHQSGLDVDVWLTPMPADRVPEDAKETFAPATMVDFSTLRVTPAFGDAQVALLTRAAQSAEVERIFVSPVIKRALCERATGDRSWLRKVRPWVAHVWHMHVRLACPAGSPGCAAQDPPPAGDGCGAELQSWFDKTDWANPKAGAEPREPVRLRELPAECRALILSTE